MKKGQRVRTLYGKTEIIMAIEESRIFTYESAMRGEWYHPTKIRDDV